MSDSLSALGTVDGCPKLERRGRGSGARLIPEEFAWYHETGGDVSESHGHEAKIKVGVKFVHGLCEGENGRSAMGLGDCQRKA